MKRWSQKEIDEKIEMYCNWPDRAPRIGAAEVSFGPGKEGCQCLAVWAMRTFDGVRLKHRYTPATWEPGAFPDEFGGDSFVAELLAQCIPQKFLRTLAEHVRDNCWQSIIAFNDSRHVPRSVVAQVWNRVMKKLGYTEVFSVE